MSIANPRISIILPTHNRADVLGYAIRSVLAQTFKDFELLIVGDGCTDRTPDVVLGFADQRIHWLDLPKAAHFGYANRNIAFKQARGEYIAFMAHDDLVFHDHLQILLDGIEDSKADIVYTKPVWISKEGIVTPSFFNLSDPAQFERFMALEEQEIPASCVMHHRSAFEKVGLWDADRERAGDWEFWIRILKQPKAKIRALPVPTCLHFLASWRRPDQVPEDILNRQIAVSSIQGFPYLTLKIDPAESEQSAIWKLVSASESAWVISFREQLQVLCDAQARWGSQSLKNVQQLTLDAAESSNRITTLLSDLSRANETASSIMDENEVIKLAIQELRARIEQLESSLRDRNTQLDKTAQKLTAIETSRGWQFLNRLREIRAALLPTWLQGLPFHLGSLPRK